MEAHMQAKPWRLAVAILGAAGLTMALPAAAAGDTSKPTTGATTTMKTSDDAGEFGKLDRNSDGYLDRTEAIKEPKLLAKFGDADANKDGKVSKDEYATFEKNEHVKK
jgi:hypothetical protein